MQVYLCVSIDCECDKGPHWRCQVPLSFEGVSEGLARRLHPLFLRYRAKPTYLLSAEVLRDNASRSWLRGIRHEAELGTHLHGEFAEPAAFIPKVTSVFQRDYPPGVEDGKLASLTAQFRDAFDGSPRSFRAGRFGIGPHSLGFLQQRGYMVDSSVTPHLDWRSVGGPSFRDAPTQPYRPQHGQPGRPNVDAARTDILEVPVTVRPSRFTGLPVLGHRFDARWLRPTWRSSAVLVALAKEEITRSLAIAPDRPVVLNCMFHNVEVVPGASPYAATERAARGIMGRMEALLRFADRERIPVVGLTDLCGVLPN